METTLFDAAMATPRGRLKYDDGGIAQPSPPVVRTTSFYSSILGRQVLKRKRARVFESDPNLNGDVVRAREGVVVDLGGRRAASKRVAVMSRHIPAEVLVDRGRARVDLHSSSMSLTGALVRLFHPGGMVTEISEGFGTPSTKRDRDDGPAVVPNVVAVSISRAPRPHIPRFRALPTRRERIALVTEHAQPGIQLVLATPKPTQHGRSVGSPIHAADLDTAMLCFHWTSRKWVCPLCRNEFDSPVAALEHEKAPARVKSRVLTPRQTLLELRRISGCNGDLAPFVMPGYRAPDAWKTRALEHIRAGDATAAMSEAPTLARPEQRRSLQRKLAIVSKYNQF